MTRGWTRAQERKDVFDLERRNRWLDDPGYQERVRRALAGRTMVQFIKDIRREMEEEDDRRKARQRGAR